MKKNKLQSIIISRYNNCMTTAKRKNITFNADEELLERLDNLVAMFNEKDKVTTRNAVIEEALLAYVEEGEDFMAEIFCKGDKVKSDGEYDTAVFPATSESFDSIFIKGNKWTNIRMAEERIDNVKYIALYRGVPTSAITHYAEVVSISHRDMNNHREITVSEVIQLENPLYLDGLNAMSVRKLFYTTLSKILSAKSIRDLL